MNESKNLSESVRLSPENWLHPFEIEGLFLKKRPFEVDVGCGKGRFLLAHAAACPEVNYMGIDRMLRRIRKVDRKAVRAGLDNVRLLRSDAYYAVAYLMPENSVSTYYIFFPDPWPKAKHHAHRLFDRQFMDALIRTLTNEGVIHFATDHLPYYEGVKELVGADKRFELVIPFEPSPHEKTDFELMFIEKKPIGRCSFRKRGGSVATA